MSFADFDNRFRDLPYRGFAFEGGGVAGLAHIGVIKYLDRIGLYYKLSHLSGSSAGAMMAGLVGCRIPPVKAQEIMLKMNFHDFEDNSYFLVRDIYHFMKTFGWNWGQAMTEIYNNIIKSYTGVDRITLKQIKERYGTTLIITATSVTTRSTVYYTSDSHPDMVLADAVRRSGGFPYLYPPIKDGKLYLIDGGLLNNYPIRKLYDYLPKDQVIGSKLYSEEELECENPFPDDVADYTKTIVEMLHRQNLKVHVKEEDWLRTIKVNVGKVTATSFDLTMKEKQDLITAGEEAARIFFDSLGTLD